MDGNHLSHAPSDSLRESLDAMGGAARDQLAAVWQLHVDRVQEQLQRGWAEQIGRVVEERVSELTAFARQEVERLVAERVAAETAALEEKLRGQAAERLNLAARRIAASENAAEWSNALLDAARGFAERTALFSIAGSQLRCEGVRVPEGHAAAALAGRSFELEAAPAFSAAAAGKDVLVVMRSTRELGESPGGFFTSDSEGRSYLFPLAARQKVVAVFYAEGDSRTVDVNALELLSLLAAQALETAVREKRSASLVAIAGADAPPRAAAMTREEQDLHSRAQRFARVQVAEMRLYQSGAVKAGRAESRLYDTLRQDIDAGREAFYRQFISSCPSMVDYFHLELVRTLANENAALLGPDYPGPLV